MILNITLLIIGTIVAFWISSICGGGASLILVPILNFLIPSSVVPFSLTVGTFASSASRIWMFKKFVNWKIVILFVPFSIPTVLLGAWLLKFLNPIYLQFFVALFLLANIPELFKTPKQFAEEEKPYPKYVLALLGFFAGFISGVTGAIGLLFNRFYLHYGLRKEEIIATRAANEIILHFIKLLIYIALGLYSANSIWLGISIAFAAIVSTYTVKYILPYLSETLFRKIGYGAMVISGITLTVNTTAQIIKQDKIAFSKNSMDETTMKWRESSFVLEFAFDDGIEVEMPIQPNELPLEIRNKYDEFLTKYDKVLIEKVYTSGSQNSYELYCYKNNTLSKFEFNE